MNRLAQLSEEHGFKSDREAAKTIGFAYSTYRSYVREEREMNSEILLRFADFYGVSVDYILCRSDERQQKEEVDEITQLREMMRDRPELPFLMNLAKNAKASDILQASALLQRLKEESEG